ncbi:hypothetical protein [Kitasatospora sp. GAS204B]|uniref:hypothetical protein n=1 Tax=unclassified Kitasatospora TaxID=2633591 RepID=UPI002474BF06|nr:hypothetical protein [Kitasatospora sp. GAS204B]
MDDEDFLKALANFTTQRVAYYSQEQPGVTQPGTTEKSSLVLSADNYSKLITDVHEECIRKLQLDGYPGPPLRFSDPEAVNSIGMDLGSFSAVKNEMSVLGAPGGNYATAALEGAATVVHELAHYEFDMKSMEYLIHTHPREGDQKIREQMGYSRNRLPHADMVTAARGRVEAGLTTPQDLILGKRYYETGFGRGKKVFAKLPDTFPSPHDRTAKKLYAEDPILRNYGRKGNSGSELAKIKKQIDSFNENPLDDLHRPGRHEKPRLAGMSKEQKEIVGKEFKNAVKASVELDGKIPGTQEHRDAEVAFVNSYSGYLQSARLARVVNFENSFAGYVADIPTENYAHTVETKFLHHMGMPRVEIGAAGAEPVVWRPDRSDALAPSPEIVAGHAEAVRSRSRNKSTVQNVVDRLREIGAQSRYETAKPAREKMAPQLTAAIQEAASLGALSTTERAALLRERAARIGTARGDLTQQGESSRSAVWQHPSSTKDSPAHSPRL